MKNKDLKVEYEPTESLVPYARNANIHSEEQVEQIAASIKEFGFNDPIGVWTNADGESEIVEGHGRVLAAKKLGIVKVPVLHLDSLTDEQRRAYTHVHNQQTRNSEFDFEMLDLDMSELEFDWGELGFDINIEESSEIQEDWYTEEQAEQAPARVTRGDIWQLGDHRLMCGDSTSENDVETLMGGAKADMVFTDPPYGMKKEKEGVLNDNLNFDDLLKFNRMWIPVSFENLKENGSWYCWGIDEPLMDIYSDILKPMQKQNKITFRNLLTWDKGDAGAGGVSFMGKDGMRSYPVGSEKCLFVMCGVQGFNNNKENYFEGWEPVRQYLVGEAEKVGLTPQKLKEICGVGMYSHWFGKSQFAFIPEEHYKKLQDYYKKKEYDELKKEYYSTRAYFDNTHDTMTDVWPMGRISHDEKDQAGCHATPKPIALCSRAIKTSSRENDSVLDLFGGSGSTLIACEQLNRKCYMMELDHHYCNVIIDRWETLTGNKAVKIFERSFANA